MDGSVNGKLRTVAEGTSLTGMLQDLELDAARVVAPRCWRAGSRSTGVEVCGLL